MEISVVFAYLGIILLWATTPLAISWSGDGAGFLFAVTARLTLGAVAALMIQLIWQIRLPFSRAARKSYLAAGIGTYLSMMASYWAAQQLPSGWLSVMFGLTTLFTGLFAARWLSEQVLTPAKIGGMVLGIAGLAVIFGNAIELGSQAILGIIALLFGVAAFSLSTVMVKRYNRGVSGIAITTGGSWVAAALFLMTWFLTGSSWPAAIGERSLYAILYLGIVSSVLGSVVYFYVLAKLEATQVSLIPLITPVLALLIGNWLNGEPLTFNIWIGAGLILMGFASFQFGGRVLAKMQRRAMKTASAAVGQ